MYSAVCFPGRMPGMLACCFFRFSATSTGWNVGLHVIKPLSNGMRPEGAARIEDGEEDERDGDERIKQPVGTIGRPAEVRNGGHVKARPDCPEQQPAEGEHGEHDPAHLRLQ